MRMCGPVIAMHCHASQSHREACLGISLLLLIIGCGDAATGSLGLLDLGGMTDGVVGPVAHIEVTDPVGLAPFTLTLEGRASTAQLGQITDYLWDFGDDTIGTGEEVYHTYALSGIYTTTLTVEDSTGDVGSTEMDIAVLPTFTIADYPDSGTPLTINYSVDSVADIPDLPYEYEYLWDYGDGETGKGYSVRHTYQQSGTYLVTLSLSTALLTLDCARKQVVVSSEAPTAYSVISDAGQDQTVNSGDQVTLDGSGSHAAGREVGLIYQWTQTAGSAITLSEPSSVQPYFVAPTVINDTTLVFQLTVTDGHNSAQDKVVITVLAHDRNAIPHAEAGPDQAMLDSDGNGDEVVILDGSGSYDTDGDIAHYRWTEDTTLLAEGPTAITNLVLDVGEHTITLEVTDDRGATNTDTVQIDVSAPGFAGSISSHGITWTFDGDYQVGRFVGGDWWVVGPVTIVSVTPAPTFNPSRHGSMINPVGDWEQAYDDRGDFYDESLAVTYPLTLQPGQSLVSVESRPDDDANQLDILNVSRSLSLTKLKRASVLSCLESPVAATVFRPPYAGDEKPLFDCAELRTDLLPDLTPTGGSFSAPVR